MKLAPAYGTPTLEMIARLLNKGHSQSLFGTHTETPPGKTYLYRKYKPNFSYYAANLMHQSLSIKSSKVALLTIHSSEYMVGLSPLTVIIVLKSCLSVLLCFLNVSTLFNRIFCILLIYLKWRVRIFYFTNRHHPIISIKKQINLCATFFTPSLREITPRPKICYNRNMERNSNVFYMLITNSFKRIS